MRKATGPYHSLFIAANDIAYKVWGVIYTALVIFCLYYLKRVFTNDKKNHARGNSALVDIFFILITIAVTGWMITIINDNSAAVVSMISIQFLILIKIHFHSLTASVCSMIFIPFNMRAIDFRIKKFPAFSTKVYD